MADPIKQFVIEPIIPFQIGGIDLSFTNSALWMVIAAIVSTSFLFMASRKQAIVPGRVQVFSELLYEFIAGMVRDNIGSHGRQYFPLVFTVFIVVLMGNVLGLIPGSFTYTSHVIVTGAIAGAIFLIVTLFGFINHGFGFLKLFAPPGVPLALQFILVPLELLSFIVRPFTLALRLFANMMAGHLMLKVFSGFSVMLLGLGAVGIFPAFIPMLFNTALYMLELIVALLQAYIFAVLTCIYLKDTVDLHH